MYLINIVARVSKSSFGQDQLREIASLELDLAEADVHHLHKEERDIVSVLSSTQWGQSLAVRLQMRANADTTYAGRSRRAFWNLVTPQILRVAQAAA